MFLIQVAPVEGYATSKVAPKVATQVEIKAAPDDLTTKTLPDNTKNISSNILISETVKGKKWNFIWYNPVAAAVFYRSNQLWIIFNEYRRFNLNSLKAAYPSMVNNCEQLANPDYTILRCYNPKLASVKVTKEDNNWVIETSEKTFKQFTPSVILTPYQTDATKGVFFATNVHDKNVLIINDPLIGDQLNIIPFYESDVGISNPPHYVDFNLINSAEGFVISPTSDEVRLNILVQGIEIHVPSTSLTDVTVDNTPNKYNHKYSVLPFDKWHENILKDYQENLQKLWHQLLNSKPNDLYQNHLELIKFYLGTNMPHEALGVMRLMERSTPITKNAIELPLLKGVANLMLDRDDEAAKILQLVPIEAFPEMARMEVNFLKNAANAIMYDSNSDYSYTMRSGDFIETYPENLRYKLALIDINKNFNKNNYRRVQDILRKIESEDFNDHHKKMFSFYKARNLVEINEVNAALAIINDLKSDILDREVRANANFLLTKTLYKNNLITIDQAIKNLEDMRLVWRGDNFEFGLLEYLSSLYHKKQNFVQTLRMWKQMLSDFPDNGNFLSYSAKMSRLFVDVFTNKDSSLNDLELVALFYEFRELIPIGKVGDDIVQKLAYKLIKLDLLERAESLLEHQVKYRVTDDSRIVIANELAKIYLYDHKPGKAIDILEYTDSVNIDKALVKERFYLRANCLIAEKKYDEALALLDSDQSLEGLNLKIEIYFANKNWREAQDLLEEIVLPNIKKQLTKHESENVLKLALCYMVQKRKLELTQLYNGYNNHIVKELQSSFQFLMDDGPINYKDLEKSLKLNALENFMDNFKKSLSLP